MNLQIKVMSKVATVPSNLDRLHILGSIVRGGCSLDAKGWRLRNVGFHRGHWSLGKGSQGSPIRTIKDRFYYDFLGSLGSPALAPMVFVRIQVSLFKITSDIVGPEHFGILHSPCIVIPYCRACVGDLCESSHLTQHRNQAPDLPELDLQFPFPTASQHAHPGQVK